MKRIVVLGAAESGVGAALLAKSKNFEVFVSDAATIQEAYKKILEENRIEYEEEGHSESRILQADEIIKSPGIPDTTPLLKKVYTQQIPVISEIEFASRYCKAKIIAITGTNGKTTTTLLTYHLLKSAGFKVGLGGNVGESFAKQLIDNYYDYFVLEVSSFQLDNCYDFKPYISVLLNITPDHLDRYDQQFNKYVESKFRIVQKQDQEDFFIFNADNLPIQEQVTTRNLPMHLLPISMSPNEDFKKSMKTSYYDGTKVVSRMPYDRAYQIVFSIEDFALKGEHNWFNSMCAILVAQVLGIREENIRMALKTFKSVPHRLEPVGEIKGIQFINDSKATNTDSVQYALNSFTGQELPNIIWIAGGVDKGNEYSTIEATVLQKAKYIICLGKDTQKIVDFFGKRISCFQTQSIKKAINQALKVGKPGDIVLLSPGCASFDLFKNYEDRGNQFREAVQQKMIEMQKKQAVQQQATDEDR